MVTLLKVGKREVELYWGNGEWALNRDLFLHYRWCRVLWIGGLYIKY